MKIIYAAWLLLFQCALLSAQMPDIAKSERVDALFTSLAQNNSPGFAVLIIHNGKVQHRKGYGLANLETKTPVTPKTVFDLASIGKPIALRYVSRLRRNSVPESAKEPRRAMRKSNSGKSASRK